MNDSDRNTPCACGSGKKTKKCCGSSIRPRTIYSSIDLGKIATVDMSFKDGHFKLIENGIELVPNTWNLHTEYSRSKGPKIVNYLQDHDTISRIDPNLALLSFDNIFAIDTNTKLLHATSISVTCIVQCSMIRKDKYILGHHEVIRFFEFRNVKGKPENLGWHKAILLIKSMANYNDKLKICLIVDSDLGNIDAYNCCEIPYYNNHHLPSNFSFIYASSDSAGTFLSNKLISKCDKESTKVLNWIDNNFDNNSLLIASDENEYSHYRELSF